MKWTLPMAALLVLGVHDARAQRAVSPADATVFIRLVGSVRAEFEELGAPRSPSISIASRSGRAVAL